ncbi:MAG: L,D-transpeptidase family protein [Lachnospiraceae bacterium]|nr:L,D-transpeptidase family protein [Lachnospiraceae bacterium]
MRKKLLTVLGILILIPLIMVVLIYLGFTWYYRDAFMSGVMINGVYVSGMTPEEVDAVLLEQTDEASFTVTDKYGENYEIPINEMDFNYTYLNDLKDIKKKANPFSWGLALIKGTKDSYTITPQGICNTEKLQEYLLSMELIQNQADPDNLRVEIVKEKDGYVLIDDTANLLDVEITVDAIEQAVLNGERYLKLDEAGCYVEIDYTDKMLETLALWKKVEELQNVEITCQFYDSDEVVDASVICDFISVDKKGDFVLDEDNELVLNEEEVAAYVESLAKEHDSVGGPWNFHATRGGVVTIEKGNYGYKLNQDKQTAYLIEQLYAKESDTASAIYSQTGWGDEGGDIGNTYIEVDMTNQMMYYYRGGQLMLSTPVVTGNISRGNGTPARVCYIYYKQRNRTLIGEDYRTPVSYWMAVYGNIGIHDASWRGRFGGTIYKTNGSHGCINTPTNAVRQLYEMAEEGTPVVMFY